MTPIFTNLDEKCIEISLKFITKKAKFVSNMFTDIGFHEIFAQIFVFWVVFGLSICETGAKVLFSNLKCQLFFVKI
jgi:hypothetical protein